MIMKKRSLLFGLSLMTAVSPVSLLAGPGHDEHSEGFFTRIKNAVFGSYGEQLPFGRVGKSSEASKKVAIELNDQFRFSPEVIPVAVGETLQLDFKNTGQMRHEWVIGTPFEISEHLELMRRFPDMEHDEPHNVHVDPGQSRTLVWQFNREGRFEYACLLPGHYEAGMRGFAEVK
tara:strand:+ start:642 stop:1166 length:525 start_codon:yes stop_codon:yes gene_type:complete